MTATVPDFAHTKGAEQNRILKARKIARWCWDRGLTVSDVLSADDARRRAWARAALVTPPSTMETWRAVNDAMNAQEGFAEDNPGHPSVKRPHLDERAAWLGVLEEPTDVVEPQHQAQAAPEPEPLEAPVDAATAETPITRESAPIVLPRGWAELVAMGPIRMISARCRCGGPGMTAVVVGGTESWVCANHPPQPGEWGSSLNYEPRETDDEHARYCAEGRRCYQSRCPNFRLNGRAS